MDFLNRAEAYAYAHYDAPWFHDLYMTFRSEYSVRDSVWNTLVYLYDQDVASELEQMESW